MTVVALDCFFFLSFHQYLNWNLYFRAEVGTSSFLLAHFNPSWWWIIPSLLLKKHRNFQLLCSSSQSYGKKTKVKQLTKTKRINLETPFQHSLRKESNKMNKQKDIIYQGNWSPVCIHLLTRVWILKVMVAEYPAVPLVKKIKIFPRRNTFLEWLKLQFQMMEQEQTKVDCRW